MASLEVFPDAQFGPSSAPLEIIPDAACILDRDMDFTKSYLRALCMQQRQTAHEADWTRSVLIHSAAKK